MTDPLSQQIVEFHGDELIAVQQPDAMLSCPRGLSL
jgi:hypothetical protein